MTDQSKYEDFFNQEMNLDQDQDLISHLTENLPIGIYRTTVEGEIVYANRALAYLLEYTLDEVYKLSVNDFFFDPKERKSEIDILNHTNKTTTSQVIHLKTKTGKTIIAKDIVKIVKNKEGKVVFFDGLLENVTQRQKAENELKESQTRYKILTELTMEGIIIHDNGAIVDINPSAQKLTGYDFDFMIGKNVLSFIHPDYMNVAKKNMSNKYSGTYELKIIKADNTDFLAEVEVQNVIIDGKILRVVAIRDITNRKRIEEEILSLSTAVKQSPSSIVITDTEGTIEYVNPKFTEVTGYTFEEAVGENPRILKTDHTSSADYNEMWKTITNGNTWTGEFLNKKKNGTHYWELASISPIIDEKGKIIKYLAVKEDITERKKTEVALIDSEKKLFKVNATKNMFFSIIAHDLKGPMGNLSQLLNLFKENFNDISNDEKLDYLNILLSLSSKTNDLLNDLLLWARIQMNTIDLTFNLININSLVQNSIEIVKDRADEKKINIITDVDDINIVTNESSLKTVIRNMLSNAIKFSYSNSTVKIKASSYEDKLLISFEDNGVGIPEENISKLFKIETTFTTYGTNHEKGTGLGLILCKELIERINGTIWVESKENAGSKFFISLPLKN